MYVPFSTECYPGEYIDVVSEVCPELPIFGCVVSANSTYDDSDGNAKSGILTLNDKSILSDSVMMLLISGNIEPKFFVSSFSEEAIVTERIGSVSKCERNKILEINNVNATDFLKKYGFEAVMDAADKSDKGLMTSSFILDYGNHCDVKCKADCKAASQIISRAPLELTNEGVICGGNIKEGASLSIALSTPASVIGSAEKMIETIKKADVKTVLMYSCEGRQAGLYAKSMEELETIKAGLSGNVNYTVAYVGGEICPTCVTPQKANNHEHNQTLIACAF